MREDYSEPSKNEKLKEKLVEEKLKYIVKSYNRPENCKNVIVPQYNPEIWKLNSAKERNTNILMHKILPPTTKASYALFSTWQIGTRQNKLS